MPTLLHAMRMKFVGDQSGASSIEYALLAAGIAVAIVSTVQALGTQVNALYLSVLSAFQ